MATLVSVADGNLTDAIWGLADSTSYNAFFQNAAQQQLTTSVTQSSAFTPGAITVIGVIVHLCYRSASPTGTISVGLYQAGSLVAGTQVSINIADIDSFQANTYQALVGNGLYFFKFSAPVTLLAATPYTLGMTTSSSNQVSASYAAAGGNWERALITSTTQAPSAGDNLLVMGAWTGAGTCTSRVVTMNSTSATAYGYLGISCNGSLLYGTSASTNYILRITGHVMVLANGIFRIGTQASPIPSTSTAVLELVLASQNQYGIYVSNHAVFETCGAGPTSKWTTLTANAAANATNLTVGDTTGWNNGDTLLLSATDGNYTHFENRTISGVVDATHVNITSGLTYARSGTSPNVAYIANMTRNVKIRSTNSAYATYAFVMAAAWISWRNTEFYYVSSGGTYCWLYYMASPSGMAYVDGCSIHSDINLYASSNVNITTDNMNPVGNLTFNNNVLGMLANTYAGGLLLSAASNTVYVSNNLIVGTYGSYSINSSTFSVTNNVAACNGTATDAFSLNSSSGYSGVTLTGNVASNCSGNAGFNFQGNGILLNSNYTWSGNTAIRCQYGIQYGGGGILYGENHLIQNFSIYGTSVSDINLPGSIYRTIVFKNITAPGLAGVTTSNFLNVGGNYYYELIVLDSCTVGGTGTVTNFINASYIPNVTAVSNTVTATNDSTWNGATYASYHSPHAGYIYYYNQNGSGTWKLQRGACTTAPDTAIYSGASPSLRVTPGNTNYKSWSPSAILTVNGTATISVKVRCSVVGDGAAYNGNRPRLMVRANPMAGYNNDTALATATNASNGAWETLSATVSPSGKQLLEVYVDCDGTTGWVNIDVFNVTGASDPSGCDHILQSPFIGTFGGAGAPAALYYAS